MADPLPAADVGAALDLTPRDVHPWVAMQVLRHSQISVTMDVYAEVSSEAMCRVLKPGLGHILTLGQLAKL